MAQEERIRLAEKVVGDDYRTGIFLNIGDVFSIFADGIVDFGGAFMGFGAPKNDADAEHEGNAPLDYPAPQCRKNSLIYRIEPYENGQPLPLNGVDWKQGGTARPQNELVLVGGELVLRTNDNQVGDNSGGWDVLVEVKRGLGTIISNGGGILPTDGDGPRDPDDSPTDGILPKLPI
jgi:hypothetical protein